MNHLRAAGRDHRRLISVDRAKLNEAEAVDHERRVMRNGRFIQAIANTRKELTAEIHVRRLPK